MSETYLGVVIVDYIDISHPSINKSHAVHVYGDISELNRSYTTPGKHLTNVAKATMDLLVLNGRVVKSLRIDRSDYFH